MKIMLNIFFIFITLGNLGAEEVQEEPQRYLDILRERRVGYPVDAFPLFTECSDKILAKNYVLEHEPNILKIPAVYYQTKDPSTIPFDQLPDRFVIKANHGWNMNIFVMNKEKLNKKDAINTCYDFLKKDHGCQHGTNWHLGIDRKIFVEEYIEDAVDIKFHCFYGKVAFIMYIKRKSLKYALFTIDWKRLAIQSSKKWEYLSDNELPNPPENFSLMLADCEKLTKDFDYVRFDVYYSHGNYYFSEFSFDPRGLKKNKFFTPLEFEYFLGDILLTESVDYDKIAQFIN